MTATSVETFRYRLTCWMVNRHISFVEVEDDDFRDLLKSSNPSVKDYLVKTGNSIRDWVEEDFIKSKRLVRGVALRRVSGCRNYCLRVSLPDRARSSCFVYLPSVRVSNCCLRS